MRAQADKANPPKPLVASDDADGRRAASLAVSSGSRYGVPAGDGTLFPAPPGWEPDESWIVADAFEYALDASPTVDYEASLEGAVTACAAVCVSWAVDLNEPNVDFGFGGGFAVGASVGVQASHARGSVAAYAAAPVVPVQLEWLGGREFVGLTSFGVGPKGAALVGYYAIDWGDDR